jgi:hypothetical protein
LGTCSDSVNKNDIENQFPNSVAIFIIIGVLFITVHSTMRSLAVTLQTVVQNKPIVQLGTVEAILDLQAPCIHALMHSCSNVSTVDVNIGKRCTLHLMMVVVWLQYATNL